MKKLGILIGVFGLFALVGVAFASPADRLQPASTITYNEELVVNGTGRFDSVYIGKQDEGGVTFFNGTIINTTTDTDTEAEIPVTFGDDVRIDGKIWRTEEGGDNPVRVADTLVPSVNNTYNLGSSSYQFKDAYFAGSVTVNSLTTSALSGTGIVSSDNIANGTIATVDLTADAITQTAESSGNVLATQSTIKTGTSYDVADTVTITTGNSTLFCMYSNLVSSDAVSQTTSMILYVDGQPVPHTYRRETTDAGEGQASLAASALVSVSAGSHTVEVRWNTSAGTATMYAHTLDVIELKK